MPLHAPRHRVVGPVVVIAGLAAGAVAYTATGASAATTTKTRHHHAGALAGLGHALHGTAVVEGTNGAFTTVAFERGTVTAVSATSITVKAADGYTTTSVVTSATKIRIDGKTAAITGIHTGDTVATEGTVSGTTTTAKHIVERAAKTAS